ncbi:MAG: alkaline phosphatase family protein [Chloroflexi bacterium]|nr:alkaline phosphatase family protein [Chloroflexota bacterium]
MNSKRVKKVILIGLDALMPEMVEKFVAEGNMPAIKRLMAEGVYSPMYSSPPVDTPTNWTSLATGAWTGTHGNNTFGVHLPGEPFDQPRNFSENLFPKFPNRAKNNLNQLSRAEYIWQAAEQAGKRCILVNYPGGWPPNIKKGIVVDGSGPYSSVLSRLSHPNRYIAGGDEVQGPMPLVSVPLGLGDNPRGPIPLSLGPAAGWRNLPPFSRPPLEGELVVPRSVGFWADKDGRWRVGDASSSEKLVYHLLLLGAQGGGYDRVLISREKDAKEALCVLKVGEWSGWLRADFETPYAPVRGKFKIHLEELSSDGRRVSLQRTVIFNSEGWAYPEGVGEELIEEMLALESGERAGEEEELTQKVPVICPVYEPTSIPHQAAGIAAMTRYLAQKYPWDLLIVQLHAPDGLYHETQNEICPDWALYDPQRAEEAWERFRQEYKVLDQMVGEILRHCADEETLKVVLSDHGCIPTLKTVWAGKALMEAGLLSYKKDEAGRLVLDWEKSKVILGDFPLAMNIWVNLKGREPQGIVGPGEEYERVRTEAIKALYSMRDPETGECPVVLALRTEEASFLGQWGDRVGDIVYYFAAGYSNKRTIFSAGPIDPSLIPETGFETVYEGIWAVRGVYLQGIHDCYLPNAEISGCSVRAVLVMAGPGIKRGYRLPVPPWTVDVAPTIAYLLGIPAPAQSEGNIVGNALEVG